MAEPLPWCVAALRSRTEPGLSRALTALRRWHTRNPKGAEGFRARGGVKPLLELLGPPWKGRTVELALSVLGNVCAEKGCRGEARRCGGVGRLVILLSSPGPESVWNRAARALANLALEPDGARDVLEAGAVPLLVTLTSTCTTPECLHSASRALRILAASPSSRATLCRAGALRAVASRLATLPPTHPACTSVTRALRHLTEPPATSLDDAVPALGTLTQLAAAPQRDRRRPALAAIANLCQRAALRPALGCVGAVEVVTSHGGRAGAARPYGFLWGGPRGDPKSDGHRVGSAAL